MAKRGKKPLVNVSVQDVQDVLSGNGRMQTLQDVTTKIVSDKGVDFCDKKIASIERQARKILKTGHEEGWVEKWSSKPAYYNWISEKVRIMRKNNKTIQEERKQKLISAGIEGPVRISENCLTINADHFDAIYSFLVCYFRGLDTNS